MKTYLLFILSFFGLFLNAQEIDDDPYNNRYEEAILTMRNDTTKKGEAKILSDNRTIRYRNKDTKEKYEYNYREVKALGLLSDTLVKRYTYKIITGKPPKLMRVVREYPGVINLYAIRYTKQWGTVSDYYYHFYINKGSGDIVEKFASSEIIFGSSKFKKSVNRHFRDCPILIRKIEKKEFKKRNDIEEMIDFYVQNCADK